MDLVALQHVGSSLLGVEPVSPALVGRFFTPEPPGEPCILPFKIHLTLFFFFFFQCIHSSFNGKISSLKESCDQPR